MSGSDARALSRSLLDLCRMRKLTIATAESCTGGLVAGALTDIPGSSDVIDRGFVTYSNDAKRVMLGVKATTLATFGAVSKETATAMAIGALEKAGVDLAVSITGIAGPGGATPGKPVGLVHFAVAARDGRILHRECRFGAIGRSAVRQRSVVEALRMLMELARGPQAPAKPRRRARAAAAEASRQPEPAPRPARAPSAGGSVRVVRAQARYVRTSARKARLVCDHLRGKSVDEARAILAFNPRGVARDWSKVLESAVANAENNHELVAEDLVVREAFADEGPTIKRFQPRARGRASSIRKRTSHLTITLASERR